MIDKINDEFIVDCTFNTTQERREVYKFLVDNRGYNSSYLKNDYPIIVCNKNEGSNLYWSLYWSLESAKKCYPSYPVLTFKEFKQKYLNMEEKKIIGYKLTKPEYKEAVIKICNYSVFDFKRFEIEVSEGTVEHLQKARVLDLWFEPVYEQEEFKIGDWVTTTTDVCNSYVKHKKGEVFQITEIKSEFVFFSSNGAVRNDRIRKATEEEIKKAQIIKIGGYEVKINSYQIEINNITYGKGQLLDLRTLIKLGQIKSLNVGCSGQYTVDLELLEKIIEKF
jgi:hypothetical protein